MSTTTLHLSAIQELRARPQWVCWRTEVRRSKLTKVPYTPTTGQRAESNNPASWTSYEQAQTALESSPNAYHGLGYMFHGDITGIDLDHCVDESNGCIDSWAQSMLERIPSYAEYSPSGTGIHILVHGTIPSGIRRKVPGASHPDAAIEMYSHGRYFTISEKHVPGTPTTIASMPTELEALYAEVLHLNNKERDACTNPSTTSASLLSDDDLISRARTAKNGGKFWKLWNGDTSGYLSESEADLALCSLLAFWTGKDAARIERLFQRSGLYREEKWHRNARSGETYGHGTIMRAIEHCTKMYTADTQTRENEKNGASSNGRISKVGIGGRATDGSADLPELIIGDSQLRDVTNHALDAIMQFEREAPTLFIQSARMVRVGQNEMKRPIVTQMGVVEVKEVLTQSANYYRLRKVAGKDDEYEKVSISPPREIAEQILARQAQKPYLPFPPLEAIVEIPAIRSDGTILEHPGYDPATRLYYAPRAGIESCQVPFNPSQAERAAALAVILEAIGEFPYVDEADLANALALLFTPFLRPAIKRHVPLALVDSPKPGTGKTLLADVVSLLATGTNAAVLTMSDSHEELQKSITALLIEGTTIITIDNITGSLQSKHLEAVLTADMWRGRILGQSRMVFVPQRSTWLATGNNIKLGGDLVRRCYRIRLDPHVSKPWQREAFTHEDLVSWVSEQREALIRAILTLVRGWYAAGQPVAANLPSLGTFTGWVKMVGSILAYAGVNGFLANQDRLYEEVDEESAQWEAFLQAWLDRFGSTWVRIADIIASINGIHAEEIAESISQLPATMFVEALPETLQLALKEKPASFKIRFGKALEKRVDTCFGDNNLRLERSKDEHSKVSLWRVVAGSAGSLSVAAQARMWTATLLQNPQAKRQSDVVISPHSPHHSSQHVASCETASRSTACSDDTVTQRCSDGENALPARHENEREEFEL
jgi:primase-polymerase (primpol)-like protein